MSSLLHNGYKFNLLLNFQAPLLIGCDVRNITSETLEILSNEEVINVNQGNFLYCYAATIVCGHSVIMEVFFFCPQIHWEFKEGKYMHLDLIILIRYRMLIIFLFIAKTLLI